MKWHDLKQLDRLIQQTNTLGARVEEIGVSGEGRTIYSVRIGKHPEKKTIVMIAGFHADEVIAPLTAISIIQTLANNPPSNAQICIIPVADPDFVSRNAHDLPETVTLRSLLNLRHQRDLEGHFTAETYPECVAIRQWLEQFDRIDAYLSLHSAHCISPGLFFYVGRHSNSSWTKQVARQVTDAIAPLIQLSTQDPTQLSQTVLAPGFFELDIPQSDLVNASHPVNSLSFVTHRFRPQYVGVSEMPLATCPHLVGTSLAEITQCNQAFKETGSIKYSFQEISLATQLFIMRTWIESVIEQIDSEK